MRNPRWAAAPTYDGHEDRPPGGTRLTEPSWAPYRARTDRDTPMDLTDQIRDFYDAEPCDAAREMTLSTAWLAMAAAPAPSPLRPGARALVAGCGAGREALGLASAGLEVVGVDISAASLALAARASQEVTWILADLQQTDALKDLEPFDLILCHAVADYVPDSAALLATLAGRLTDDGLLFLSVNTNEHPRARLLEAWNALGGDSTWSGSPEDRARLRQCAQIAGPLPGFGALDALSDAMIRRDLFPPMAHHRAPLEWTRLAATAGLHLRGDRRLRDLFARAHDPEALATRDLGALSTIAHALLCPPSAMLLFGKHPPRAVRIDGQTRVRADAAVPVSSMAPMTEDWDAPRSLTTVEDGVARAIPITTRGLELLRRSTGVHTLDALAAEMGTSWEPATGDLLRMLHADLLALST